MMSEEGTEENSRDDARDGPGRRLNALRQSRDLSLPRVAVMLHLDEETLTALEADDFDRLPDPVFVQGYLKNYARLLDTPVGPIMDAYRRTRPDGERQPLKVVRMKHEVKSSHVIVRLVTWLIILGLVSLLVIWWRGYLTWPPISVDERGATESTELSYGDDILVEDGGFSVGDEVRLPTESGSMTLPTVTPVEEPESTAGVVGTADVLSSDIQTDPGVESPPSGFREQSEPETAMQVEAEAAAEPERETPVVSATPVAEIEFLEDCWTDIRDASGRFRIQGVLKKGATRRFEGEPPFKIVLGNASAVKITIDGDEYDLAPHIRANVARFNLDPDRI